MKRVVVGLSGGVDSSVAAYLLKEQGYEVIGLFMKNWHDESVTISNECPWVEDSNDALIVAEKLGIPFNTIDLSKEYKLRIVDYMFGEYKNGRTPNPDILCNKEIKFDLFLKAALRIGADYVATGHYCRKDEAFINEKKVYRLLAGVDHNKDQSYFLCQLTQYQLGKSLFPIGHLTKPQVREIAREQDLVTADKKDSQGLCFIGKVKLPDFLQQQLKPKKGRTIEVPKDALVYKAHKNVHDFASKTEELKHSTSSFQYQADDGAVVGEHNGAHYFTIGQRKGINVGGKALPLFVIGTDVKENIIYTGQGAEHPGLNRKGLFVPTGDVHWIREDIKMTPGESRDYQIRIRYRQPLQQGKLYYEPEGLYVLFEEFQKGISPGQFVAWYEGEELLGSGVIG